MARKTPKSLPTASVLTPEKMAASIPRLQRRIEELRGLDPHALNDRGDPRFQAIEDKIEDVLVELFGSDTEEHRRFSVVPLDRAPFNYAYEVPLHQIQEGYVRGINAAVGKLTTIIEIFQERIDETVLEPAVSCRAPGRKVFIVHGHDEAAKEQVARFLDQIQLEPIILHEQPNEGRTIIEKFEQNADVDFAVVLLTPDDVGHAVGGDQKPNPRARQNVIFELGFFVSSLTRSKVVALYKGGVEIPSDYHGVLYTKMDDAQGWKLDIAREIKRAGIAIDMNLVV